MVYCTIDHLALKDFNETTNLHRLSGSQHSTVAPKNYADCLSNLAH